MKNLGIAAIVLGIAMLVLVLIGAAGQTNVRVVAALAAVLMIAGYFLYKRG